MRDNLPDLNSYAPGGLRAQWTLIFLWAGLVANIFAIIGNGLHLVLSSALDDSSNLLLNSGGEYEPQSALEFVQLVAVLTSGLLAVLQVVIYIATIIAFLMWIHRAYRNLEPLGVKHPQYSPGWAVGAWFVPFLNLVRPFQIIREIWTESDPEVTVATAVTGERYIESLNLMHQDWKTPDFLGWWWGLWIASNVASNISRRLSSMEGGKSELVGALSVEIIASALTAIAAFLAIKVVRGITARQNERYNRLAKEILPPFAPSMIPFQQ
ncbi:MAG TPA: DUF4328 domain-containing protein [Blastocatellia bacterium]|nr:DUF4328 domain-containing protein [Blastocatellia bacterium]